MKDRRRCVVFLAIGLLSLASRVSADEPKESATGWEEEAQAESVLWIGEAKRWNAGFIYGSTVFRGSEAHQTLGATFRIRMARRLSVESELRYMSLPSYESATRRSTHSDLMLAGHVVYDFRDEATKRVIPYVMGGVGWIRTRNQSTYTPRELGRSIPVFPAPPPPQPRTSKDVTDWLWIGGTFGVRVMLPQGFFVFPELRLGGGIEGDVTASAGIKMGYGF